MVERDNFAKNAESAPAHSAHHEEGQTDAPAVADNGQTAPRQASEDDGAEMLRKEIERLQEERDSFEAQYNMLVGKVAHMRTTLGDRLRLDAEELDRREQQIERLTSQVGQHEETVSTWREELRSAHKETERVTAEMDHMRTTVSQETSKETAVHKARWESRCEELQETINAQRIDMDRWECAFREERAQKTSLEERVQQLDVALEGSHDREAHLRESSDQSNAVARQLQQTLEELQIMQDREMQRTAGQMQAQVDAAEAELVTYKLRLQDAEAKLEDAGEASSRSVGLEQEVKEKNLLIGKLRHEAVILNEHLTVALRQLRRNSPEALVDRHLMTNLLLQFLAVPRTDAKKFEILRLIASVLKWDPEQRERAGLQRTDEGGRSYGFLGFGRKAARATPPSQKPASSDELIRHGEKFNDHTIGLSPMGKKRAECVTEMFSHGDKKVDAILVQDYKSSGKRIRPYETVKGLGKKLGIPVDYHCDRDDAKCAVKQIAHDVRKGAKRILVCWEHDALADIAALLGVEEMDYPSDRFDIVFQLFAGQVQAVYSEACPNIDAEYAGWVGTKHTHPKLVSGSSWAAGAGV
ncbi:hypothetical protein MSPP1_001445 [Malassezia sp. CBS 17886]|nr:hypothetical protein MSPP1_001445 [Malassezia sp. CBS 17886]